MIASPLYHQKASGEKAPHALLKYVSQRSLAIVMFIAFALLASVGNKSSEKTGPNLRLQQSSSNERYLALNPGQLVGNVVRTVKDAFSDPALVEYGNEQGVEEADALRPIDASKQNVCSLEK